MKPVRGEIYTVRLDPTEGSEIKKSRPAVIISDNAINESAEVVIVCPITKYNGLKSPIHIFLPQGTPGLAKESIAHCGQIRAIAKSRLIERRGYIDEGSMTSIDNGLKIALALN